MTTISKAVKPIISMLLCFFAAFLCLSAVSAADSVIDLDREGSVSVTVKADSGKVIVTDGSLSLYKIADIQWDDTTGYKYVYTEAFSGCDPDLLETPDTAQASKAFAEAAGNAEPLQTQSVGSDDAVKFDELSVGLYLVAQAENADGYQPINAFTVSVPLLEDGVYVYDVDASPKAEPLESTPTSEEPPGVSEPNVSEPKTSTPGNSEQPVVSPSPSGTGSTPTGRVQTGDIIAMCAAGVAVIAAAIIGITVLTRKKGGDES